MSTKNIKVNGMTCKHCIMRVEKSLLDVDTVTDVKINLNSGEVTVNYTSTDDLTEKLKIAVENAGYKVG